MKHYCYKHKRRYKEQDLPCINEICNSDYCPVIISEIVKIPKKKPTMKEIEEKITK